MELRLLAVGKLKPALREVADDYLRRLRRYADVIEVEVREAGTTRSVAAGRREEAVRLRERMSAGSHLVVLDREGSDWSSEDLATHLDRWRQASRLVTLALGGSHGLDPDLVAEADQRWSLGRITLPHQLARVVVAEQLYRAWTILRREPYHK